MIDRLTIERIKESADIVDVVSEFVSLKRSGSNYKGLCPFHSDRNPSFYVSPSRGTCKCFTCGEGGDSVGFLMKHEQLSYPEALRWLAKRYNIEIQEKELSDDQRREQSDREGVFIVNKWTAEYYHDVLLNDVDGRAVGLQYFRQRGFRDDIVKRFQLGFATTDRYAMPRAAKAKGYSLDYLEKSGTCYKDNKGELVDRFTGRAIFPWIGVSGNVVAFGGRVLDARTKGVNQKYVNSPDSIVYHKDHELYGIFQAKRAIGKEDCVYMVEGYTDVISMHQCGIENVVANSGTALSVHQIRLLHRFTSNIILLYDGDEAGIHAALRGTDMLLADGMNVKVLLFPDGDDPDSFAKKHNAEDFRKYIADHQTDFIEFKTRVLLQGVTDPVKRSEAINSIVKSVSMIPDPIMRATYIKDCSSRLGINEHTLITTMNNHIREYRDEKRKEEERNRNQQASAALQQPSPTPSTQPSATSAQSTDKNNALPSQGNATPSGMQGYDDMPPPDAFLPPEAFGDSPQDASHSSVSASSSASQQQSTAYQQQQVPAYQQQPVVAEKKPQTSSKTMDVQTMLIHSVVLYGERIIFENVELDDGTVCDLNVAQYIQLDFAADELSFRNPLYNQILNEAVEHSSDEGFNAESYFRKHHDYNISTFAVNAVIAQVPLMKSFEIKYDQSSLREHILHIINDFRWEYINERLAYLRTEMSLNASDRDRYLALIGEYQGLQKLRFDFAKRTGRN